MFVTDVDGLIVSVTRVGETEEDTAGSPQREWFVRWGDAPVWDEAEVEMFPPELGASMSHTYPRAGLWFVEMFSPGEGQVPPLFEVHAVRAREEDEGDR